MKRLGLAVLVGIWGGAEIIGANFSRAEWSINYFKACSVAFLVVFVGAAFAGAIVAPLLMRRNIAWYIFACLLVTTLGGMIGGTLIALGNHVPASAGIVYGAAQPWLFMQQSVVAASTWLAGAVLLRVAINRYSLK